MRKLGMMIGALCLSAGAAFADPVEGTWKTEPGDTGGYLHVDLAGPAYIDERGTGFGVGLALALLEVDGFCAPATPAD